MLLAFTADSTGRQFSPSSAASSVAGNEDGYVSRFDESAPPKHKTSGFFFGKPARNSPSKQLAYAKELEREGRYAKAGKAYNALVRKWGASREAAEAQYGVARMAEKRGKELEAFREYQYLLENYNLSMVDGANLTNILQRQFAAANTLRAQLGTGFIGLFEPSVDTVAGMFRRIASSAPAWDKADDCMFMRGLSYETMKKYVDALYEYEDLASRYPDSELRGDALYRAAVCRYVLAMKSPRDGKTMRNAVVAMGLALRNDPSHKFAKFTALHMDELNEKLAEMAFEKAEFYDTIRKNPSAALIAYQTFLNEFPESSFSEKARQRVKELSPVEHSFIPD